SRIAKFIFQLRSRFAIKRRSVYRKGETGSKGNWLRKGKAEAALSHIGIRGLRNPSFRRPLERIGDPQISPTRPFKSHFMAMEVSRTKALIRGSDLHGFGESDRLPFRQGAA